MTAGQVVLIVDDDAGVRKYTEIALGLAGFSSISAENGDECLNLLERGLKPGLVLLDIMMPKESGCDVCARIKNSIEFSSFRVFLYTALPQTEVENALKTCRADGYIIKGSPPDELAVEVGRAMDVVIKCRK